MSVAAVWALGLSKTALCSGDPGNTVCHSLVMGGTFYFSAHLF